MPLRLPCKAASGGTRCIVSVRPEDLRALLQPEAAAAGAAAPAGAWAGERDTTAPVSETSATATLCGCLRGLRPSDCLGATLVGLLRVHTPGPAEEEEQQEQAPQKGEENEQQGERQQDRQHQEQHQQQDLHQEGQQQKQQQKLHEQQSSSHQEDKEQQKSVYSGDFESMSQQQPLRKLQFIEGRPANLPESEDASAPPGNDCSSHIECLGGYGKCVSGRCRGFIPDVRGQRIIKCVDGYNCDAKKGDLPTKGPQDGFVVIAIGPDEECGAAVNLRAEGQAAHRRSTQMGGAAALPSRHLHRYRPRRSSRHLIGLLAVQTQ